MNPTAPIDLDTEFARIVDELTRRGFLAGGLGTAALATLAACGSSGGADTSSAAPSGWTFTDDRGRRIELDHAPQRIVAFIDCAAALNAYGIDCVGYFGATTADDPRNGGFDITKATSVGDNEINTEKLATLRPDLIISNSWFATNAPNVINDAESKVAAVAPVAVVSMLNRDLEAVIRRYAEAAEALGAAAADVDRDRAAYDQACAAVRAKAGGLSFVDVYNHNDDGLWIGNPTYWPFTQTLSDLGLTAVSPGKDDGSPVVNVSWERLEDVASDLVLLQDTDLAATHPKTWELLPAVKAGQVIDQDSSWYRFTYDNYARLLNDLAGRLAGMRHVA